MSGLVGWCAGMIATKVAALVPQRVASLNVISSTSSGMHMAMSMLFSPILTVRSFPIAPLKSRVRSNLRFNFSPAFLDMKLPQHGRTRRHIMMSNALEAIREHVANVQPGAGLSKHGQEGQLRAVMQHRCTTHPVPRLHTHMT